MRGNNISLYVAYAAYETHDLKSGSENPDLMLAFPYYLLTSLTVLYETYPTALNNMAEKT